MVLPFIIHPTLTTVYIKLAKRQTIFNSQTGYHKSERGETYCLIGSRTGFPPFPLGVEVGFICVTGASS
jgi:hypothetical protein